MRTLADVRVVHAADVVNEGNTVPVYAWIVDGPDGAVVVDTGMIDSTPALDEEWAPTVHPWPPIGRVACVVNTHLHFDHCGGNRLYAGTPIYVQRAELAAARAPDYLEEWVWFEGARYVELDGDAEVLPGIAVLSTPGHSPGHQAVVVETDEGPVVLAGDVTYFMRELIAGATRPSVASTSYARAASTSRTFRGPGTEIVREPSMRVHRRLRRGNLRGSPDPPPRGRDLRHVPRARLST